MERKKEIRAEVRRRIKELTTEQMTSASTSIFSQIEQLDSFKEAHCIALFAAMRDEVPTQIALDSWPKFGRHIV
ncbi:MAG: 5-formyltetrahydrofolate cyclo-ligase, partial [Alistipes sp.]|nr:5-formyltetrahydrofolate cyclo-ligase [Alistipes sp.]